VARHIGITRLEEATLMGKICFGMTMSLDGFVADRDGDLSALYPDMAALRDSDVMRRSVAATGAVAMGRRSYDMAAGGDWSDYEFDVPIFVLTHRPPARPDKGRRFTFVTDGVESLIRQARAAAGAKDVTVVGGADTGRQLLRAGLVDELQISVMPVLLGGGLRLFDELGPTPIQLERVAVFELGPGTELRYRVVR
jgi:dihydrofolate reductase